MIRHLIAGLLAALLLVSAVGAGVARGHLPPADAITICSDHGLVTIYLDERGEPVERQILCPDCVVTLHAVAPGFAPGPWRSARPGRLALPRAGKDTIPAPAVQLPEARAPPVAA